MTAIIRRNVRLQLSASEERSLRQGLTGKPRRASLDLQDVLGSTLCTMTSSSRHGSMACLMLRHEEQSMPLAASPHNGGYAAQRPSARIFWGQGELVWRGTADSARRRPPQAIGRHGGSLGLSSQTPMSACDEVGSHYARMHPPCPRCKRRDRFSVPVWIARESRTVAPGIWRGTVTTIPVTSVGNTPPAPLCSMLYDCSQHADAEFVHGADEQQRRSSRPSGFTCPSSSVDRSTSLAVS